MSSNKRFESLSNAMQPKFYKIKPKPNPNPILATYSADHGTFNDISITYQILTCNSWKTLTQ